MSVEIHTSGPIFDGRAAAAAHAFVAESERVIAAKGSDMVKHNLRAVLRHPTGYYESRVSAHGNVVQDGGVIYGPWLEGVGSRNSPVTRFPGYFTFRRTTQELRARSVPIAEELLHARYLKEMQ
jgi:hypothetical protein